MPEPVGYSKLQIALHWSVAALVLFQLFYNNGMQEAFNARLGGETSTEMPAAIVHMVAGILVLVLAALRLGIRLTRGVPGAHAENPAILNWLGTIVHYLLYGFIFLMPLTGIVAWFGGVEFSAELHELGRLVLVPAIGLHVIGALAEHFVFHNNSLRRMLAAEPEE